MKEATSPGGSVTLPKVVSTAPTIASAWQRFDAREEVALDPLDGHVGPEHLYLHG